MVCRVTCISGAIHTFETDGQSFEADTIGRYIGEGLGGIVFRLMDEDSNPTDKVLKVVRLGSRRKLECHAQKHKPWEPLIGSSGCYESISIYVDGRFVS